jgi:hypothetical protein
MDTPTAAAIAFILCIGLWVPYFFLEIRRGKALGHTWFTWWKPRGHPDIGWDFGGIRQTRPGVDDGRWARY